jgi:hypothetical protein
MVRNICAGTGSRISRDTSRLQLPALVALNLAKLKKAASRADD